MNLQFFARIYLKSLFRAHLAAQVDPVSVCRATGPGPLVEANLRTIQRGLFSLRNGKQGKGFPNPPPSVPEHIGNPLSGSHSTQAWDSIHYIHPMQFKARTES